MTIAVTITKVLDDLWATPEQLAGMTDKEIIEMVSEDLTEFVDGSTWTITGRNL